MEEETYGRRDLPLVLGLLSRRPRRYGRRDLPLVLGLNMWKKRPDKRDQDSSLANLN